MPKGDKYIELTIFLKNCGKESVCLTFHEIEEICKTSMPASVKRKPNQLVPSARYSFAYGWLNAGYQIANADLEKEFIVFQKMK